jgi:SAM-dependent methyltransferase
MKTILLPVDDVLAGYDAVSALYPHIPPLATWRGWEYAAYRRYQLPEPVLDVGCGDGRYFKLVWPKLENVVGVELDPATAAASRESGVYRQIHVGAAHDVQLPPGSCGSAFANCALEHMDHLPEVLANVQRALKPGAPFLLSVVTDKWREWAVLPLLARLEGMNDLGESLQRRHDQYHHLVNALPPEQWAAHLTAAGFEVLEHVPILPEVTARLVLFFDQLWHLPARNAAGKTDEIGSSLHPFLTALRDFPRSFRHVLEGLARMESNSSVGCGAVFWARKKEA